MRAPRSRTGPLFADQQPRAARGRRSDAHLSESLGILLEGTPAHIDVAAFERAMLEVPGVQGVHVWTIASGMESMSGHGRVACDADAEGARNEISKALRERFGIDHTTIQIEAVRTQEEKYIFS